MSQFLIYECLHLFYDLFIRLASVRTEILTYRIYMQMRANQTRELRVRGKCNIDRLESCAQFTSHVLHIYIGIASVLAFRGEKLLLSLYIFKVRTHRLHSSSTHSAPPRASLAAFEDDNARKVYGVYLERGGLMKIVKQLLSWSPTEQTYRRIYHWSARRTATVCLVCFPAKTSSIFAAREYDTKPSKHISSDSDSVLIGGWTRESVFY